MPTESQAPSLVNALPEYSITLLDFQRMFPDAVSFLSLLGLGVLRPGLTYREVYSAVGRENLTKIWHCTATGYAGNFYY